MNMCLIAAFIPAEVLHRAFGTSAFRRQAPGVQTWGGLSAPHGDNCFAINTSGQPASDVDVQCCGPGEPLCRYQISSSGSNIGGPKSSTLKLAGRTEPRV